MSHQFVWSSSIDLSTQSKRAHTHNTALIILKGVCGLNFVIHSHAIKLAIALHMRLLSSFDCFRWIASCNKVGKSASQRSFWAVLSTLKLSSASNIDRSLECASKLEPSRSTLSNKETISVHVQGLCV